MSIFFGSSIKAPVADLRQYTPQALGKIRKICAATVILPENMSPEFAEAWAGVKSKKIAGTIYADATKHLSAFNGVAEITDESISDNAILMANGIFLVSAAKHVDIMANGVVVYGKSADVNFLSNNGMNKRLPFDTQQSVILKSSPDIDRAFISALSERTVILVSGGLNLDRDIVPEALSQREIFFAVSGKVQCSRELKSVLMTKSVISGGISCYE